MRARIQGVFSRALPVFVAGLCALTTALSAGQLERTKPGSTPSATAPVTQREAYSVLHSLETALLRTVLASAKKPASRTVTNAPISRLEVIREFDRLVRLCAPKFKFTPRKIAYDPSVLSVSRQTPERRMLENLVALGLVGKVSAIATNSTPHLTITEFGDALGLFMGRLSELTHTPSSKWSPYMNQHAG